MFVDSQPVPACAQENARHIIIAAYRHGYRPPLDEIPELVGDLNEIPALMERSLWMRDFSRMSA